MGKKRVLQFSSRETVRTSLKNFFNLEKLLYTGHIYIVYNIDYQSMMHTNNFHISTQWWILVLYLEQLLYFKMHHRIQYLNPHQRTWNWIFYVLPASTFLRWSWIFQIPPVFLKTPPSGAIFFEWGVNKVVILHQMFRPFWSRAGVFLGKKAPERVLYEQIYCKISLRILDSFNEELENSSMIINS